MWFSWQKLGDPYHGHTVTTGILILPAPVTDKRIIIIYSSDNHKNATGSFVMVIVARWVHPALHDSSSAFFL